MDSTRPGDGRPKRVFDLQGANAATIYIGLDAPDTITV
jgi:hypothetical protein